MGGGGRGEVMPSAPALKLVLEGKLGKWSPFPSWGKEKKGYTIIFKIKFIGVSYIILKNYWYIEIILEVAIDL